MGWYIVNGHAQHGVAHRDKSWGVGHLAEAVGELLGAPHLAQFKNLVLHCLADDDVPQVESLRAPQLSSL